MERMAATGTHRRIANARGSVMKHQPHSYAAVVAVTMLIIGWSCLVIHTAHSQSGRQKNTNAKPSPTPASQRPRQATATRTLPPPPVMNQTSAKSAGNEPAAPAEDVVRVSSHLVPVPTTVLDGAPNNQIEDFELVVDPSRNQRHGLKPGAHGHVV